MIVIRKFSVDRVTFSSHIIDHAGVYIATSRLDENRSNPIDDKTKIHLLTYNNFPRYVVRKLLVHFLPLVTTEINPSLSVYSLIFPENRL